MGTANVQPKTKNPISKLGKTKGSQSPVWCSQLPSIIVPLICDFLTGKEIACVLLCLSKFYYSSCCNIESWRNTNIRLSANNKYKISDKCIWYKYIPYIQYYDIKNFTLYNLLPNLSLNNNNKSLKHFTLHGPTRPEYNMNDNYLDTDENTHEQILDNIIQSIVTNYYHTIDTRNYINTNTILYSVTRLTIQGDKGCFPNQLIHLILNSFPNLIQLRCDIMYYPFINNTILSQFRWLTHLRVECVGFNDLDKHKTQLKNNENYDSNNSISDSNLYRLPLNLNILEFQYPILQHINQYNSIFQLINLVYLKLGVIKFTITNKNNICNINELVNLTYFSCTYSSIIDPFFINQLSKLPELRYLDLNNSFPSNININNKGNNYVDECIYNISNCNKLVYLNLGSWWNSSYDGKINLNNNDIEILINKLNNLKILILSRCYNLTKDLLLLNNINKIKYIDIPFGDKKNIDYNINKNIIYTPFYGSYFGEKYMDMVFNLTQLANKQLSQYGKYNFNQLSDFVYNCMINCFKLKTA